MTHRVSDAAVDRPPDRIGVVVPLRSLADGKLRLAQSLSLEERRALISSMAAAVVRAAHDLPVLVVHDDRAVGTWARGLGADAAISPVPGLNAAVDFGRRRLAADGVDIAIIAHADLPLARDLRPVATFAGITLVPDRLGDGTNVLCLPTTTDFTFAYGPGSFTIHRRIAAATGLPVRVLDDPDLAWDVDHPDDLAAVLAVNRNDPG